MSEVSNVSWSVVHVEVIASALHSTPLHLLQFGVQRVTVKIFFLLILAAYEGARWSAIAVRRMNDKSCNSEYAD